MPRKDDRELIFFSRGEVAGTVVWSDTYMSMSMYVALTVRRHSFANTLVGSLFVTDGGAQRAPD